MPSVWYAGELSLGSSVGIARIIIGKPEFRVRVNRFHNQNPEKKTDFSLQIGGED